MGAMMKTAVLMSGLLLAAGVASANDCGWSNLTTQEQSALTAGQPVMHHAMDADGARSHIDQWAFSGNSSLLETTSNFYDESQDKNTGGVADISLADGEVASNNPVIYDVTPKAGNPFGQLYQPFSYSEQIKADGEAYQIVVNYLSSPGLIKHVLNDICIVKVQDKVLIQFLSTVTDNPMLPISGPAFGWDKRLLLWGKIFSDDMARSSQPGDAVRMENLQKALAQSAN